MITKRGKRKWQKKKPKQPKPEQLPLPSFTAPEVPYKQGEILTDGGYLAWRSRATFQSTEGGT